MLSFLPRLKWTNFDSLHFKDDIDCAATNLYLSLDCTNNLNNIIECVKNSAFLTKTNQNDSGLAKIEKKQDWFDFQCNKTRKRVFKLLN